MQKSFKTKKICSIFLISCNISQHKQRFWNVFILYIWPFPIFCTVMIGFAQIRKNLILLTKKVKCTCQPWRQGLIYIMTPLFDQKPLDLAGGKLCWRIPCCLVCVGTRSFWATLVDLEILFCFWKVGFLWLSIFWRMHQQDFHFHQIMFIHFFVWEPKILLESFLSKDFLTSCG